MVANSQGEAVWNGQVYDSLPSKASTSAWGKNYLYTYIYSNTRSYCYDTDISDTSSNFYRGRLISLLSATGYKIEGKKTGYADSTSLFQGRLHLLRKQRNLYQLRLRQRHEAGIRILGLGLDE
jgi:hypothetical protein